MRFELDPGGTRVQEKTREKGNNTSKAWKMDMGRVQEVCAALYQREESAWGQIPARRCSRATWTGRRSLWAGAAGSQGSHRNFATFWLSTSGRLPDILHPQRDAMEMQVLGSWCIYNNCYFYSTFLNLSFLFCSNTS